MPAHVMSDFEVAIINAVEENFGEDKIKLCFFHLKQNIFRRIQAEGLQEKYNDPENRQLKLASGKLCALSFVPADNVADVFSELYADLPEDFLPVADYFQVIFVF